MTTTQQYNTTTTSSTSNHYNIHYNNAVHNFIPTVATNNPVGRINGLSLTKFCQWLILVIRESCDPESDDNDTRNATHHQARAKRAEQCHVMQWHWYVRQRQTHQQVQMRHLRQKLCQKTDAQTSHEVRHKLRFILLLPFYCIELTRANGRTTVKSVERVSHRSKV